MKKKFLSIVVFIFSIFFIGNIDVFAANNPYIISAHDIPSDTYVIGTHVFDTNRDYLSTEDIMWAARTIEDVESKDDMIIYYKNYDGEWINGRTGENVTVPSTFKIEEVNGKEAKGIAINTVLEEFTIEGGGTGYSSIHEDDYNMAGLWLKNDETKTEYSYEVVFDAFNIEDGEYNFSLQCHDYEITEDDYIPTPFNIGTMPSTVTVSNGVFRLPIEFNSTNINDYVSCAMELEQDEEIIESGFTIDYTDAEPTLSAFAIEMTAKEVNGEGIGFYPVFGEYQNFYDIYSSDIEINELELVFKSRFIEEGDYNIEIDATKDGEEINIDYDEVFIIGEGADPAYGLANAKHYLTFDEPITPGEYEFYIYVYDANEEFFASEIVRLTVTPEASMTISSEVWEDPEVYYSLDELVFDNSKKRKFNLDIFTENIPTGTYAIKAKLDYANYVPTPVNFELKYNQNVEIIKPGDVEYFDFAFEIPKTTKVGDQIVKVGHGKYYVELTLHELEEDEDGNVWAMEPAIARTGFYFTINKHVNGIYGDISGDGKVSNDDTILLRQALVGTHELTYDQLDVADVNQDNTIDNLDVQIIRKHIVDNITLPYDSGDKYPINYELNGGTFEGFYDTVYANIALPFELTNPVKEGYRFTGWVCATLNISEPQINVTIPEGMTGPLNLTANWELAE